MDFRLQESPQTHVLSISIPCFIWEGAVVPICKLGMGHFRFQKGMPPCLKEIFTRYFVHFLHFLGMCVCCQVCAINTVVIDLIVEFY